jgi:hypothetical protein
MSLRVSTSGTPLEVISLAKAKQWLSIDFSDWDDLIQDLINSATAKSQKVSGSAYWPVTVTVTGNTAKEYIYPIEPVTAILPDPENEEDYKSYTYEAGYAQDEVPDDLKRAILQRVATGFNERQNGYEKALSKATETSLMIEISYRNNLYL